jgi:peptidyl-prolyl cis-trans isomerase D
MLDRMRQHRAWLQWSLVIVVISFVALYIPSCLQMRGVGAMSTDTLAVVEGRTITMGQYNREYQRQLANVRAAYGGQIDERMIKQLGLSQRMIQQLVDNEAVLAEASRLGIKVSDEELKQRMLRMPELQRNGQFVGHAAYQQFLRMQRPPMTEAEFEGQIRNMLIGEKLHAALTGWMTVPDNEVEAEYRKRNEKVKLEVAVFTANQFRTGITPTDAELEAQFKANQETYRIPEKRRVRFLSVDAEGLRARQTVTPQEVEARYKTDIQTYSSPEQIRASHILLKTEGKDEAVVRKQAEEVLKKVKAGGDFAALAKQYSEDSSKAQGGDLDYFGRGKMVKEFEDAAWPLNVGQTTDLVKSEFGFHIIKLTDKKAAATRPLAEVRAQVEDRIRFEKASAEAARVADEVAKEIDDPTDLDRVAQARGMQVGDSGLFARDEPLAGLGFAPAVAAEAFRLETGKVSGQLRTGQGSAFIHLVEIKPPALPTLAEVKDKVRDDVIRQKAVEVGRTRAATMAQAAAKGSFAAAAKAAGVEVKTTELLTRGSAYPEVGVSNAIDDAVFKLQKGQTTAPIPTESAVVVARVADRQDIKPEDVTTGKDSLRNDLADERRNAFFSSYMRKAQQRMSIEFSQDAIKTILGGS